MKNEGKVRVSAGGKEWDKQNLQLGKETPKF